MVVMHCVWVWVAADGRASLVWQHPYLAWKHFRYIESTGLGLHLWCGFGLIRAELRCPWFHQCVDAISFSVDPDLHTCSVKIMVYQKVCAVLC